MPKTAMDYSKTLIYHFVCQDTNITSSYVGSTTNLSQRKNSHKRNCHNESHKDYNILLYKTIRDNGGWTNWKMVVLEEYPECQFYYQQTRREQEWINRLKPELNMRAAYVSEEDFKEQKKEYLKEYREKNKEQIKEQHHEWCDKNKDKIKEYNKKHWRDTHPIPPVESVSV